MNKALRAVAAVLVVALALWAGGLALAQSGGGFGGSGGSSGGSSGGGGFGGSGGGYSGGGSYGGGYGGGFGYGFSPFLFGGGGGGSIVGLIVIAGVVFVAYQFMRRSLGSGAGALGGNSAARALKVQLLMGEGDDVKRALQQVASGGDPDSNEGLARMLSEAALVALRHPERWTYGEVEGARGAPAQVEAQVGAWAAEARAAFQVQTTSNYQNQDVNSGFEHRSDYQGNKGGLYLAMTIAVAAEGLAEVPPQDNAAGVRAALLAVSGVQAQNLLRAEVVWSPDAEGEYLSEDEAIMKYPKLTKI